jgi:4'-phosphopantetheinyl transferase EntD
MSVTLPTWPEGSPLATVCEQHRIAVAFCPAPGSYAEKSAAVRVVASALLARAGLLAAEIGRHPDGQPLWPDGWVGSLTHSRTLGAAALAPAAALRSLGIDLEDPTRLKPALWPHVLTPAELAIATPARAAAAFSAKEAIYKTLGPLTPELPGFHDVDLLWSDTGEFRVQPAAGRTTTSLLSSLRGLAQPHADHVLALCWLPH